MLLMSSLPQSEWANVDALVQSSIPAASRQDAVSGDHDPDLRRLQTLSATRETKRSSHQQWATSRPAMGVSCSWPQRGLSSSHCASVGWALATVGHRRRADDPIWTVFGGAFVGKLPSGIEAGWPAGVVRSRRQRFRRNDYG